MNPVDPSVRSRWMALLAKSPLPELENCMARLETLPIYDFLRSPEIGLAMVRGRTEGAGAPFNLGEMTLTRCVVQMAGPDDTTIAGFGYVAGRSHRHAELAAVADALCQHPKWRDRVLAAVVEPLRTSAAARQAAVAAQAEATRVNFFTLQRGEG